MSKLTERLREGVKHDEAGPDTFDADLVMKEAANRIEQFVTALDEEKVVSHIGVFNEDDDPRKAIKDLMLWSQGVGEYFEREKVKKRIKHLERVLVQARNWMTGPNCQCFAGCEICENWPTLDACIAAIDEALKEQG